MDFKLKTSDEEGTRFATVPQIGMSGVPQVRVGVVGRTMRSHTFSCNSRIIVHVTIKIALGFASCNYLTVTGTIILELHSNVCDYLRMYTNLDCRSWEIMDDSPNLPNPLWL